MKTAITFALLMAWAPSHSFTQDANVITLTDGDRAECRAGGGCVMITVEALRNIERKAIMTCGPRT